MVNPVCEQNNIEILLTFSRTGIICPLLRQLGGPNDSRRNPQASRFELCLTFFGETSLSISIC